MTENITRKICRYCSHGFNLTAVLVEHMKIQHPYEYESDYAR